MMYSILYNKSIFKIAIVNVQTLFFSIIYSQKIAYSKYINRKKISSNNNIIPKLYNMDFLFD